MAKRQDKPKPTRGPPTLAVAGAQLRSVLTDLEDIHTHVIVCHRALIGQNADHDAEVAEVLRLSVSAPLDETKLRVAQLAARCDGIPPGDDYAGEDESAGGAA